MTKIVVSAICPARDEADNIQHIFKNFKNLGGETEVLFVEGGSTDDSWKITKKLDKKKNKYGVFFRALKQKGQGKAAAVVTGFDQAKGEYLIIADADMTVPHQDLVRLISLFKKYGDHILVCGNRLKGLPKPKSFYWLNYIGNYFFRYYYSFILKDTILDIACGTKGMTQTAWKKIRPLRKKEGTLDKWGDIDWLYYGKRVGLQIKFADVNYAERSLGESKLQDMKTRVKFAWNICSIGWKILQKDVHK
jgi:glycosyltransferase involved in cell wall biosynthesis